MGWTCIIKPHLHKHQVIWITIHYGRGGLSLDLNPVCLRVNATNLDQDVDQNLRANGALERGVRPTHIRGSYLQRGLKPPYEYSCMYPYRNCNSFLHVLCIPESSVKFPPVV